jgi:hypothetical protein
VIAKNDTSACSSRLKLHADVSLTAIMKAQPPPRKGHRKAKATEASQRPERTDFEHSTSSKITKSELGVALKETGSDQRVEQEV